MIQRDIDAFPSLPGKRIDGDIHWQPLANRRNVWEFWRVIPSHTREPLRIKGRYNSGVSKLSFNVVSGERGRVYSLDMGRGHTNLDGVRVGEIHKNYWSGGNANDWAYRPEDITAPWNDPVAVWAQFCAEARLEHNGVMYPPGVTPAPDSPYLGQWRPG